MDMIYVSLYGPWHILTALVLCTGLSAVRKKGYFGKVKIAKNIKKQNKQTNRKTTHNSVLELCGQKKH